MFASTKENGKSRFIKKITLELSLIMLFKFKLNMILLFFIMKKLFNKTRWLTDVFFSGFVKHFHYFATGQDEKDCANCMIMSHSSNDDYK